MAKYREQDGNGIFDTELNMSSEANLQNKDW